MSKLILARHGETTYNAEGRWTGLTDVALTPRGQEEARQAGQYIAEQTDVIHVAHYSMLRRTYSTMLNILGEVACCPNIDIQAHAALNERNYGIYTGKRKNTVREQYGEEEFLNIRRGWDHPVEDGETLKDVYNRVTPLHENVITPDLASGKTTLVVSSNNTLRAYVKHLENIPEDNVSSIELGTAEVRIYDFNDQLDIVNQTSHAIGSVH